MPWASIAVPIAASVIGGMMSGGGSQSSNQSQTRTPWAPAAPWLTSNVNRGQDLQKFYQANPFSPAQQQAYGNQFALSNSYRANMPGLMQTMNNTGTFDRMNPTASRPQMFQFQAPANLGFSADPFAGLPTESAIQAMKPPAAQPSMPNLSPSQMTILQQMISNQQNANQWNSQGS